ncbi:MAG TPA: demethoxyubiquinone hydroxylase family protein, partial [Alphaproteobacteria bacterium]|nr:demethoxyubiquinone hydroxylase family protein [Alphaproteobacteria bacterium]
MPKKGAKVRRSEGAENKTLRTSEPPHLRTLDRILRVNQAGEYGAKRIYQGQIDVLKRRGLSKQALAKIQHMAAQEEVHLAAFNEAIA